MAISRETILQRPKRFWERAWSSMNRRSNYELLLGTKFVSARVDFSGSVGGVDWTGYHKPMDCVFEHLWHVLFNPHAKSWLWPTRLRDPSLPMSFKFDVGD